MLSGSLVDRFHAGKPDNITDDLQHTQQPHAVTTTSKAGVHEQQQASRLAGFTTAALIPGLNLSLFSDMQTTEHQHIEQQPRR